MTLELEIKATGEDAWFFLPGVDPGRGRIKFTKATFSDGTAVRADIMALIMTNSQEVDLAIQPLDKRGKPAQVDGVPVWSSSDPAKVEVAASDDGLSCVAKALNNGTVQISVSADADLGDGIRALTGTLDLEIVSGEAVTLGIIAGTPREQEL